MAIELFELLRRLGIEKVRIVGHDRGAGRLSHGTR
jgi:pimeloyl-ACP methyl ester carboxylesterase